MVISAPESVVGTAHTRPPLAAATAFAVSITRPPPQATTGPSPTTSTSAAAASTTWPAGTSCTERHESRSEGGIDSRALGVESRSAPGHARSPAPEPEVDHAVAVGPRERLH